MTTTLAHPWLPACTATPAAIDRWLGEVVDGWSVRWFASEPATVAPLTRAHRGGRFTWWALEAGVMTGVATDAPSVIGATMLALADGPRAPCDAALLEELAEECLADLQRRLATLAQAPKAEWRASLHGPDRMAEIGIRGRPLLAIGVREPLFVSWVKAALPVTPADSLGSGAAALACSPISVSAAIGRCAVTLADLHALTPGDVVVLDTPIDGSVPIAVDGKAAARGRCDVVAAEPFPFLQITQAFQ